MISLYSRRAILAPAFTLTAALTLASCATTSTQDSGTANDSAAGEGIVIGTTDKVTRLDPAGSYDKGSNQIAHQIYGYLFETQPGSSDPTPQPSLAESGEFTSPDEYTVTLKPGLSFANGNELTSSDVKHSFDRQLAIADANGPSSLLANLDSVETPDDSTVVFKLKSGNDQTWLGVLSSPAAPIVDEDIFPADALLDNDEVATSGGFAGQYDIDSYADNELVTFSKREGYIGLLEEAKTDSITMKYYADASNMKLDIQQGNIDVAYRSLSATDISDLRSNDDVEVVEGPGGEIRYMVFNLNTQPFGAATQQADAAKAKAVRQAVAASIDRQALATDVYKDTYTPLYGHVASVMHGATEAVKDKFLTADGGPDVAKAEKILKDAGITEPVALALQYNPDHYGPSSGDEYAAIKSQLEATGLFTVDLQSTEWVQYNKDRVEDVYPVYQLGWFPDFSDPDNYLTPFFTIGNFVDNHFEDQTADALVKDEATTVDEKEREEKLAAAQDYVAEQMPTVPLLEGKQFAIAANGTSGVILDGAFLLRFGPLSK